MNMSLTEKNIIDWRISNLEKILSLLIKPWWNMQILQMIFTHNIIKMQMKRLIVNVHTLTVYFSCFSLTSCNSKHSLSEADSPCHDMSSNVTTVNRGYFGQIFTLNDCPRKLGSLHSKKWILDLGDILRRSNIQTNYLLASKWKLNFKVIFHDMVIFHVNSWHHDKSWYVASSDSTLRI